VNKKDRRKLANRKRRIQRRLEPRQWPDQTQPVFSASNIHYEVSGRIRGSGVGGIGAVHALARCLGLPRAINQAVPLLKRHLPYFESDHVLSICYNVMAGHTCLEDLELLRQDESYMDILGAQRIPDPTTEGDFLRRFEAIDVLKLMDVFNQVRRKVWMELPGALRQKAIIDVDGTLAGTCGEKKEGMSLSYNGIWGYHPLLVSLANFGEPLYIVNRPGNVPSHSDAPYWLDKAIDLCKGSFSEVLLRGDTDFSLTANFDRWTEGNVKFVFGFDAISKVKALADELEEARWHRLERPAKYDVETEERDKRSNVKEQVVKENEYKNIRLKSEDVAEFFYRPGHCTRDYRMVVVRKNLSIEKGEKLLMDDIRYFFYVTNDERMTTEEVVYQANERCNQENLIEQLKSGIGALRAPVNDLVSNWAYMVIASLAWSLKAWFGLTLPRAKDREDVLAMEFKRFLNALIRIPCQVIKGGRRIVLRLLAFTNYVRLLFTSLAASAKLNTA
jgi:Transposase DDE domain group 1